MLNPAKRYAVFSLHSDGKRRATIWTRAGNAFVNKDGSMNLYLDVLPIDGKLHVREAAPPSAGAPLPAGEAAQTPGAPSGEPRAGADRPALGSDPMTELGVTP